jgi:hypothetical protein
MIGGDGEGDGLGDALGLGEAFGLGEAGAEGEVDSGVAEAGAGAPPDDPAGGAAGVQVGAGGGTTVSGAGGAPSVAGAAGDGACDGTTVVPGDACCGCRGNGASAEWGVSGGNGKGLRNGSGE